MQTMYYAGYTTGCLLISRVFDIYGRKWPIFFCLAAQFPLYLGMIISWNYDFNIALSFFLGVTCVGRYDGCFIAISEYVHSTHKNKVGTLLLVFDSFTSITIMIYYRNISRDWLYL